jgi:hypothetical protein
MDLFRNSSVCKSKSRAEKGGRIEGGLEAVHRRGVVMNGIILFQKDSLFFAAGAKINNARGLHLQE